MPSDAAGWQSPPLRELRAELQRGPALADRILATLPAVPEPDTVLVRVSRADADRGICRALALAVVGIPARVELEDR